MKLFKDQLKKVMNEKGYNITTLSNVSGIGKSSLSQYLSGKNIPSEERIEVLAKILECSLEELSKDEDKVVDILVQENEVWNVPVDLAAKLMHKKNEFLYQGLQEKVFPFGFAVKTSSKWTYYISSKKFTEYTGIELRARS